MITGLQHLLDSFAEIGLGSLSVDPAVVHPVRHLTEALAEVARDEEAARRLG